MTLYARYLPSLFALTLPMAAAAAAPPPKTAPSAPAVGRTQVDYVDCTRPGTKGAKCRRIAVWFWYPARPDPAKPMSPWLPRNWLRFAEDNLALADGRRGKPAATLSSGSVDDALFDPAHANRSLLVFTPGAGEIPLEYSKLAEGLARRGYVVAGIAPAGHGFSAYIDGTIDEGEIPSPFPKRVGQAPADPPERTWARDISWVIDRLTTRGTGDDLPLETAIDSARIGVFGHSLGGTAALLAAKAEPRIAAVIDLDGMMPSDDDGSFTIARPVLVLGSDMTPPPMPRQGPAPGIRIGASTDYTALVAAARPGLHLILRGSSHQFPLDTGAFDLQRRPLRVGAEPGSAVMASGTPEGVPVPGAGPMLMPGDGRGPLGPPHGGGIPGPGARDFMARPLQARPNAAGAARLITVTTALSAAFFDDHLLDRGRTLNAVVARLPEVRAADK